MQEIIVPVDFSSASGTALRFAARLAAESDMQVRVVYPYHSLICRNSYGGTQDHYLYRLEQALTAWTAKQLGALYDAGRLDVRVIETEPGAYLTTASRQPSVALVVMGRPDRSEGGEGLTEAVECPVVLLPAAYDELAASQLAGRLCGHSPRTYRRRSRLPSGLM